MKTPEEVLDRALIILLLADRGLLEHSQHEGETYTVEQREQKREYFLDILESKGLQSACADSELEILRAPVGDLSPEVFNETQWQFEAIPVLLWTVGLCEFPAYDGRVCAENFYGILGKYRTDKSRLPADIKLLEEDVIDFYREASMLWHWRSTEGTGNSYFEEEDAFFYICELFGAHYANLIEVIPLSKESPRDFLVSRTRFNDLSDTIADIIFMQSQWRHHALEWAVNQDTWEDTDTST
jgi:hypothetical protein